MHAVGVGPHVSSWPPMTTVKPLAVPRAADPSGGYHERPRPEVARVAGELGLGGVVCDFGCGAGVLGQALLEEGLASSVIGVEHQPAAAERAATRLTSVIVADVRDALDAVPARIDAAILADLLEHLADPAPFLREVVERLSPDGKVIVSVPNVRHARVVAALVGGNEWRYAEEGVCDETHLRFFTSKSAERMLRSAGLLPLAVYGTVTTRGAYVARLAPVLTTFLATQIVFGCVKKPAAALEGQ